MKPLPTSGITGIHVTIVHADGDSYTWSTGLEGAPGPIIQSMVDDVLDDALLRSGYIQKTRWQKRESLRKFKQNREGAE